MSYRHHNECRATAFVLTAITVVISLGLASLMVFLIQVLAGGAG